MSPLAKSIEEEGVYIDPFKLVEPGALPRTGGAHAAHRSPLPGAQPRAEHRRPESAGRRQREGRRRAAQDGAPLRARHGARLYGPCAGQRGGSGAARDRQTRKIRASRWRPTRAAASRSPSRSTARQPGHGRFHRHQRADRRTLSTRPSRSRALACSMCSAPWSTTTFRSTPAACATSRSSCREGSMLKPRYPAAVAGGNVETSQTIVNCLLRRARRARLGARHHEQSHFRQCALSILRDDLLGRAGRARLRRRARGTDAYD